MPDYTALQVVSFGQRGILDATIQADRMGKSKREDLVAEFVVQSKDCLIQPRR